MDKSCNLSSVPLSHSHSQEEDRISQLPDHILVDILSKLTSVEAGKTSFLSHSWVNLWKHVPRLFFDLGEGFQDGVYHDDAFQYLKWPKKERRNYVDWVNHVFHLRKSFLLQELVIYCDLPKRYNKQIDKWLEYAFTRRVQKIDLNLSDKVFLNRVDKDHCTFPYQLLYQHEGRSENLIQVDDCGGIPLPEKVDFSCLKSLRLTSVNISGEFIEVLLKKCPLLEELKVCDSGTLVNLVISGPSLMLKHLELTYCGYAKSITISNLNLVSLKVSENRATRSLTLSNLPLLVEVYILGCFTNFEINVLPQFSCCLSQLTVLSLCPWYPKTIMNLYRFPELGKLRRLVIILEKWKDKSLLGLTSLISFCPNLEEFVLKFLAFSSVPDLEEDLFERRHVKDCSFKHLKVFELYGYYGRNCEVELVSYIIRNAIALKKMVIVPHLAGTGYDYGRDASDDERLEIARKHAMENVTSLVPEHVQLTIL